MVVSYCGSDFEVPDILVDKFFEDFNDLPGSAHRESVCSLRDAIEDIMETVAEEPDILDEADYMHDFIHALAMRKALEKHGILYDA